MQSSLAPVRFSHLKSYGRSPAHGRHARLESIKPNAAMQRGTAVHAILSGTRRVVGYPGPVRRGKDYDAFVEQHPDTEILTMVEYDKACRMADAIMDCEAARPLLVGTWERTIEFSWMGLPCRATPDLRGADFLTEIKTTSVVEPTKFNWHCIRMAYHAQMRMQQIAAGDAERCYIVAVESEAPFVVQPYEIHPQMLEAGERLLVLWAERLKACELAKEYPGYSQSVLTLTALNEEMDLEFAEENE